MESLRSSSSSSAVGAGAPNEAASGGASNSDNSHRHSRRYTLEEVQHEIQSWLDARADEQERNNSNTPHLSLLTEASFSELLDVVAKRPEALSGTFPCDIDTTPAAAPALPVVAALGMDNSDIEDDDEDDEDNNNRNEGNNNDNNNGNLDLDQHHIRGRSSLLQWVLLMGGSLVQLKALMDLFQQQQHHRHHQPSATSVEEINSNNNSARTTSLLAIQSENGDIPLHVACSLRSSDYEMVEYLVQAYPKALTVKNAREYLPIHEALLGSAVAEAAAPHNEQHHSRVFPRVFQLLLTNNPESMHYRWKKGGSVVGYCFVARPDLLPILLKHYRKTYIYRVEKRFHCCDAKGVPMDMTRVSQITSLFAGEDKLKSIGFHAGTWTSTDAFLYLMEQLQHYDTVEELIPLTLPADALRPNTQCFQALHNYLRNTKRLGRLLLRTTEQDHMAPSRRDLIQVDDFLQTLQSILQNSASMIGELRLERFVMRHPETFIAFVASRAAPYTIKLNQVEFLGQSTLEQTTECWDNVSGNVGDNDDDGDCNSKVEVLWHDQCPMDKVTYFGFLQQLPRLKRLRELSLISSGTVQAPEVDYWDITPGLVTILEGCQRLETLIIEGYTYDMVGVGRALERNNCLLHLVIPEIAFDDRINKAFAEMLQEHNQTLEKISCEGSPSDVVNYYMYLNRLGRTEMVNPNTSRERLIQILSSAVVRVVDRGDNLLLSLQYGLLRESPALWCNYNERYQNTNNLTRGLRKRKHGGILCD